MWRDLMFPTFSFLALATVVAATPQPAAARGYIQNYQCNEFIHHCTSLQHWCCNGYWGGDQCDDDYFCPEGGGGDD